MDEQQARSAEQFHRQAGKYGRGHILEDTRDVLELLADVPLKGGRGLDVATGGGHTALALANAGFRMMLGDLAPAMLENAARFLKEEGHEVETALFAAEAFPFEDESFDVVSCRVAPHHFSDVGRFVRESFRVLKRGGYWLVIDGSLPDGDRETAEWLHVVEKLRDPSHGRFLERREWRELAEEAGFEVVRVELQPMEQPDLEWYFEAAATPAENREKVRALIAGANDHVRTSMGLETEGGRVSWTWQRVSLLAVKR